MNSQTMLSGRRRTLRGLESPTPTAIFLAGALLAAGAAPAPAAAVTAHEGRLELPTYPWWPAVRHPYFRGTDDRNIYPYPMMDNLSRTAQTNTWKTVVLENEYLRVTFMPELGGRIYEVLDKIGKRSMFYANRVVKPGLIGQCGAWISGGVEFNTGPAGHTVSAMLPVDVQILPPEADGSRSVAVGELEKIYRTRWTVVVTLRPGRTLLEESIRIYNGTETIRPYYFWNCTAMPNTRGFRFVYPMTLGSDHGGDNFFKWPIDNGKDLSLGRTYQDASSIFAYGCDQDFFGSYDEDADYGVVSYANRHQLPGKKAWTWGNGGYGVSHQMDLTDADGPYNEVQTGPLLTQANVGRLEPQEAVAWREWWYPVRGLGGFAFANRDLAANPSRDGSQLRLRLLGTGTWKKGLARVLQDGREIARAACEISPERPAILPLEVGTRTEPLQIQITAGERTLADFRFPLDLPMRTPPAKRPAPDTAAELAQAGWQDFLFARFSQAESTFRKALGKDARSTEAQLGLAFLNLDRDPAAALEAAKAALAVNPDSGLAHFALAVAAERRQDARQALDHAWLAALDPATATPARSLVARLCLRADDSAGARLALAEAGPWQSDPVAMNRLAFACLRDSRASEAARLARRNLEQDPLDAFARSLLWLAKAEVKGLELKPLIAGKPQSALDLAAEYTSLGDAPTALRILESFGLLPASDKSPEATPIAYYWAAYLSAQQGASAAADRYLQQARAFAPDGIFPHRRETVPVLRWAIERQPQDGQATLYLGHLLFSLGVHAEGRQLWQRAAELGTSPAIAFRALAMASRQLDGNADRAVELLERARQADPADAIVVRDLAQMLYARVDKAGGPEAKRSALEQVRDRLQGALAAGRARSDYVGLLARAYNRLGEFERSAKLLDEVRITIWEGGREVHDLFEDAHFALGKAHLAANRHAQALAEFDRALEYPANLATGKLETDRQAHIQLQRGHALAALGRKAEAVQAWRAAVAEPASSNPKYEDARKEAQQALDKAGP